MDKHVVTTRVRPTLTLFDLALALVPPPDMREDTWELARKMVEAWLRGFQGGGRKATDLLPLMPDPDDPLALVKYLAGLKAEAISDNEEDAHMRRVLHYLQDLLIDHEFEITEHWK